MTNPALATITGASSEYGDSTLIVLPDAEGVKVNVGGRWVSAGSDSAYVSTSGALYDGFGRTAIEVYGCSDGTTPSRFTYTVRIDKGNKTVFESHTYLMAGKTYAWSDLEWVDAPDSGQSGSGGSIDPSSLIISTDAVTITTHTFGGSKLTEFSSPSNTWSTSTVQIPGIKKNDRISLNLYGDASTLTEGVSLMIKVEGEVNETPLTFVSPTTADGRLQFSAEMLAPRGGTMSIDLSSAFTGESQYPVSIASPVLWVDVRRAATATIDAAE